MKKTSKGNRPGSETKTFRKICLYYVIAGILSLIIILGLRGIMNALSRMDSILQRLDEYPHLYESYQKELKEWDSWWLDEDLESRADEAVVLYRYLDSFQSESEKLAYIAGLLEAEEAIVSSWDDPEPVSESLATDQETGSLVCRSPIDENGYLTLRFSSHVKSLHALSSEITDSFIRRVEAGLPGHIMICHEGTWSVYPNDEEGTRLLQNVSLMQQGDGPDPEVLRQEALKNNQKKAVSWKLNESDTALPGGRYLLYCCAFTQNDDYVVGAVPVFDMLRLAGKRSWSLWLLCMAVMILLGFFVWRTHNYLPGQETETRSSHARNRLLLATALLLLLFSILYVQQMSAVSQNEQTASEEAAFLQYALKDEETRRGYILTDYDLMYADRAAGIASLLSDHPDLIDPYILYQLDSSLGGSGLRVTGVTGSTIASDRALMPKPSPEWVQEHPDGMAERTHTAVMEDQQGKAHGVVILTTLQQDVADLLIETEPQDIIKDLVPLNTLHVVGLDHDNRDVITVSTNEKWVGDHPQEHHVNAKPFYDGYEGLVNFGGNECYSTVFQYKNTLYAVGTDAMPVLVFLGGVLLLLIPLTLLLLFGIYRPMSKAAARALPEAAAADPDPAPGSMAEMRRDDKTLSPLRLVHGYMVAFFLNTLVLYAVTSGDSSGMTYKLIRGTWTQGVNAITAATFITLISMVFAIHLIADLLFRRLFRYLSQQGKTIGQLFVNAVGYIGIIVVIVYALSMFGVNTTTLVGGVGVTALVFTLGANSLISDILAGLFIILDGDYAIGDIVQIGDFNGVVEDISIRTTSLKSNASGETLIIRNSMIKEVLNKSKQIVSEYLYFQIGRGFDLEEARARITEAVKGLDKKYPELIGEPFFGGIVSFPEIKPPGIPLEYCTASVGFRCLGQNRSRLAFALREELVTAVNDLMYGASDGAIHVRIDGKS